MYRKFDKIYHLGVSDNEEILSIDDLVVAQSKIDGASIHFWIEEDGLHFGRRNAELAFSEPQRKEKTKWLGIKPVCVVYQSYSEKFNKNYIYYGESMQKHNIAYDNIPDFVGYDIFDMISGEYLPWKVARKEFEKLHLSFICVRCEKPGKDYTVDEIKEMYQFSPYREKGIEEGIILKCYSRMNAYGRPLRGKIVNDEFKERKKIKKVKDIDNKDEINIVQEYVTPARIQKAIYQHQDLGDCIDLPLMKLLPNEVIQDVLEENILEIYKNYKKVNFKTLRKLAATQCLKELRTFLETKTLL